MAPSSPSASGDIGRERRLALGVLLTSLFMSLLATTIAVVANPSIGRSLNASSTALVWVLTGYALALGLTLLPAGRLGDRFGHRSVFLAGLGLFTLASLGCALSTNVVQLVVARVLQGVGGGLTTTPVTALIQVLFSAKERLKAFSAMGAVVGTSTALGPVVAGAVVGLSADVGWRWAFALDVPIGLVAIVLAAKILPRSHPGADGGLDLVGLSLATAGLLALLVPLGQSRSGTVDGAVLLGTGLAIVLLALAALWSVRSRRRGGHPLLAPHLFAQRRFTMGCSYHIKRRSQRWARYQWKRPGESYIVVIPMLRASPRSVTHLLRLSEQA